MSVFSENLPEKILLRIPFFKSFMASLISTPTRIRLAQGAFWGGIAAFVSRIFLLATSFFLARFLGQSGFGEYGMVISSAGMISSFAGLGFGLTITKYISELKLKDPERSGRIVALSTVITLISSIIYALAFVSFSPFIAERFLAAPQLSLMLQISSITAAMGVINGVQSSLLTGLEAFRINSFLTLATSLIQSGLVVLFAWKGGLKGAVVAMAASMTISVVITSLIARRERLGYNIRVKIKDAFSEWKVIINFSLPSFLTLLIIGPAYWICNTFLANQSGGYSELGIFNAAIQWQTAVAFLPGLLGTAMIPVLSDKVGNNEFISSLKVVKQMMKVISIYTIPVAIILFSSGHYILEIYGVGFKKGYMAFVFVISTGVLAAITAPVTQYVVAKGDMWMSFWISLIWAIFIIGLSYLGAKTGAQGLALSRLAAQVVHTVFFCYFVFFRRKDRF
jgi:O-antigen/teichoic acid export membrane protein